MDELSEELGRSKSNIFANLRGLEGAGIVERNRPSGTRHDTFALRGKYPDVVVGAYLTRLRRVVLDKVSLCNRALGLLGDAEGAEADALREKLTSLLTKYERFAGVFAEIIPVTRGRSISRTSSTTSGRNDGGVLVDGAARAGLTPRALGGDKKASARKS